MSPISSTLRGIAVLTWAGCVGTVALAVLAPDRYSGIVQGQTVWATFSAIAVSFIWRSEWRAARVLSGPVTGMFLWVLVDLARTVVGWPERLPEATDTVIYLIVAVPTALASAAVLVILFRHDFRPELEAERLAAERARSEWVNGLVGHIRSVIEDARTGALPVLPAAMRIGGLANGMDGSVPVVVRSAVYRARDDLRAIASTAPVDQDAQVADAAARFDRSIIDPGADAPRIALPRRHTGLVVLVIVLVVLAIAAFTYVGGSWSVFIDVVR